MKVETVKKFKLGRGLIICTIIFLLAGVWFYKSRLQSTKQTAEIPKAETSKYDFMDRATTYLDIDGDNTQEIILLTFPDRYLSYEEEKNKGLVSKIQIFSSNGDFITESEEFDMSNPHPNPIERVNLNEKEQALMIIDVVGMHHLSAFFFVVKRDGEEYQIEKLCPSGRDECSFFNSVGDFEIKDLDNDGNSEVTEMVDEYPPEGGRGNPVLSGVFRYDNGRFVELQGKDYDKIYEILSPSGGLIKLSESRGRKLESMDDYFEMTVGNSKN